MAKKDPKSAPQQSQQLKKKKKTEKEKGPQQQPALLLPPDEETQSLHPRKLSKKYGSDSIIKLLQHEARNCPMKNAPPKKLLTLVGGFLTSYGFNSACGLFQLQCNARNNLDGWDSVVGAELPKDHPNLLQVYQEWEKNDRATKLLTNGDGLKETKEFKDEKIRQEEEDPDYTSSSGITTSEDDSNSSSDSDILANSDVEMKDETSKSAKGVKEKKKSASTSISKSRGSFSSSFSSSSNSDNDTDDKKEPADDRTTTSKPNVTSLIQNLKKSSDAAKAKIELQAKKSDKPVEKLKKAAEPTSSSSSSAASGSDSDSSSSSASSVAVERVDDPRSTNFDRSTRQTKSLGKQTKSKRVSKAAMSTSSDDSSASSIDSDVPAEQADTKSKSKATLKRASLPPSESSSSSPSSSNSDSSSSPSSSSISKSNSSTKPAKASIESNLTKTSSDSTATIVADSPPPSGAPVPSRKRTHSPSADASIKKAKPQNFQRVPLDTTIDKGFESNRYRSYDYADRAHKNLSVVKGNAFIKEKNKQKRKSYRGGVIDIEGSRGVKFA